MSNPNNIPVVYLSYLDIVNTTIPVINVYDPPPIVIPQPYLYVPVDKTMLFGADGFRYAIGPTGTPVAHPSTSINSTHLSNCITAALTSWRPDPLVTGQTTYTIPFSYISNTTDTFEVDAEEANTSVGVSSLGDHIMLIFASIYNSSTQVSSTSDVFTDLGEVTSGVTAFNQNIVSSLTAQLGTQSWQDQIFQSFVGNNGYRPLLDGSVPDPKINISAGDKDMALVFNIRGLKMTVSYGSGTTSDIELMDVPLYLHLTDDPLATVP